MSSTEIVLVVGLSLLLFGIIASVIRGVPPRQTEDWSAKIREFAEVFPLWTVHCGANDRIDATNLVAQAGAQMRYLSGQEIAALGDDVDFQAIADQDKTLIIFVTESGPYHHAVLETRVYDIDVTMFVPGEEKPVKGSWSGETFKARFIGAVQEAVDNCQTFTPGVTRRMKVAKGVSL